LESEDNFCGKCGKAVRRAETTELEKPKTLSKPVIENVPKQPIPEYTPPPAIPLRNKSNESKDQKKREAHMAELRKMLEKEQGREISDQELFEAEHWLTSYAELMLDLGIKEVKRQDKLKENPKGFHLEGEGYSCFICRTTVSNEQTWYDKYGIKCLTCQSAINKKIIPATVASDKDSWYSINDLEHSFFITRYGVKKLVKDGLLKPRTIPGPNGGVHYQLFLIKDHEGILPPKELTKWPMVKSEKDGEEWYHSEPWLMHADPSEVLNDYKILEYLGTLEPKHIKQSFPKLSFQINKAAKSMLKVDSIEQKDIKPSKLDKNK
jgi:hypothetical protein